MLPRRRHQMILRADGPTAVRILADRLGLSRATVRGPEDPHMVVADAGVEVQTVCG